MKQHALGGRVVKFVLCIYERETPQMVSTLRNYTVKYGSYLEVHADIRLKTQRTLHGFQC
jgi:hypothetical protein